MQRVRTSAGSIAVEISGQGHPLLLLHGFPQTGLMWRDIAPDLSRDHTVVVADLPGYGESDPPKEDAGKRMSKRSMGSMLVDLMAALGHERFAVAGHDRGGRVAYRIAMDHPHNVTHLVVMDVIPTSEVWGRADARMALAFWPYSFLAQPAPLPETLLLAAAEAVVDDALTNWGTPPESFSPEVRDAYVAALRDPSTAAAICDEYRAASTIDREHDQSDRQNGKLIECPTLVLWDAEGGLGQWYEDAGGPLGIWRRWAVHVTGEPMEGGHFFPEHVPARTTRAMAKFLSVGNDRLRWP
ncbi:alpha/beta fold hydrolase [Brevundimonas sp. PAMC22021]|uniref:alpha/beta fold hydrolase n=1 Tax=Brevundimonas sp. PAMC22021 TaxID=2861285 RepID=UPI001C6321D0|nr:alpha/beta hydrolase [Brevundimonas sp. PAMC22021]QYF87310.1 alpha/beta hydrolase [Brevundimonas sp. PAMC22021]